MGWPINSITPTQKFDSVAMKLLLAVAITFLLVFNCQSDEDLTPFIAWSDK